MLSNVQINERGDHLQDSEHNPIWMELKVERPKKVEDNMTGRWEINDTTMWQERETNK